MKQIHMVVNVTRQINRKYIHLSALLTIHGARLLSKEEAETFLAPLSCECPFWLQSHSIYGKIYIVSSAGQIDSLSPYSNAMIRPALVLENLNTSLAQIGDEFTYFDEHFKIISDTLAILVRSGITPEPVPYYDYFAESVPEVIAKWYDDLLDNNELPF